MRDNSFMNNLVYDYISLASWKLNNTDMNVFALIFIEENEYNISSLYSSDVSS